MYDVNFDGIFWIKMFLKFLKKWFLKWERFFYFLKNIWGLIVIKSIVFIVIIDLFFVYLRLEVRGYKVKEYNRYICDNVMC